MGERALLALSLGTYLCACVGPSRPYAPSAGPPGTVIVSTRNAYGWPLRHRSTRVELDGEPIRSDVPVGSFSGAIHTVSLTTEVEVPCGLFPSDAESIRIDDERTFVMAEGAASIFIRIRDDGDPLQQPADRIRVDWDLHGVRPADIDAPFPRGCVGLDPVRRAECRVSAEVEHRRREHDLVGGCSGRGCFGSLLLLRQGPDDGAKLEQTAGHLETEGLLCQGALPGFLPQPHFIRRGCR